MAVDILDLGSGNIGSIVNWIESVHVPVRIVKNVEDLKSELLIVPGVGSVGSYMERLRKSKFDEAIKKHVNEGKRLLGICLGFQIMSDYSVEDGGVECLGLISGKVERLNTNTHNGWESFKFDKRKLQQHSLNSKYKLTRKKIIDGRVFYNHEYGFRCNDLAAKNIVISDNFKQYSGIVIKNKIIGIQFHPEKSQQTGRELIAMIL